MKNASELVPVNDAPYCVADIERMKGTGLVVRLSESGCKVEPETRLRESGYEDYVKSVIGNEEIQTRAGLVGSRRNGQSGGSVSMGWPLLRVAVATVSNFRTVRAGVDHRAPRYRVRELSQPQCGLGIV